MVNVWLEQELVYCCPRDARAQVAPISSRRVCSSLGMHLFPNNRDDLPRFRIDNQHLALQQRVEIGPNCRNSLAKIMSKRQQMHCVRNHFANVQSRRLQRFRCLFAEAPPNPGSLHRSKRKRVTITVFNWLLGTPDEGPTGPAPTSNVKKSRRLICLPRCIAYLPNTSTLLP